MPPALNSPLGSSDSGTSMISRIRLSTFLFFAGQGVDFTEAVLDLDRETSLPKALMLTTSGKKSQTFVFKETKVNPTIAAENFAFKKLDGWKVVRNPDPNVRPNKVAAKPRKVEAEGDAKEPDRPR